MPDAARSMRHAWRALLGGVACAAALLSSTPAAAACAAGSAPALSFVQLPVPNLANPAAPLTVKAKLSFPGSFDGVTRCISTTRLPAVVILHGSSGVDSRGDFYQSALNAAGYVTLALDMWEARGVTGLSNRPAAPILTYPDAFVALNFLASLPEVNAARIGVLGFSWGGVISLASSELAYATTFGGGRRFAAHVAHYPVCYGANSSIPALMPNLNTGTQYLNVTGAPVLIQIGTLDDYDNGSQRCKDLADLVNARHGSPVVQVQEVVGAYHAFDRLMVPVDAPDIFGNEGSYFSSGVPPTVRIRPDVAKAMAARTRVVQFFRQKL